MQESARWERRISWIVFGAITALAAITPLGKEATHPLVFATYRALLLTLVVAATWGTLRNNDSRRVCPYFLGCLISLGALLAISVWLEPGSRFEGIYIFYKNALFGAAFVAAAAYSHRRSLRWKQSLILTTCAIGVVHLAVALVMARAANDTGPLFSFFTNPNYFASYLLPCFAVAVAYTLYGAGTLRVIALTAAVFLAWGILQTVSRGATLAGLLLLGVALFRVATRRLGARRVALAGSVTLALVILLSAPYTTARQATPAVVDKFLDRGERDPYNYARPLIWLSSLKIVAEHPVFGVGLGRYSYAAKRFTPAIDEAIARYRKFPNIAHNEYLQYAAETGLPAAALLMALAGYVVFLAWKRGRQGEGESQVIQEAAILAAIGVGAHALVDNNWTVPVLASTLAVVSSADLLPWRNASVERPRREWSPVMRAALVMALGAVFVESTLIPAVGLYFNEEGHRAYIAGQFERAESMHSLALGVAPDHPVLLDNLGMVYLEEFMKTRNPARLDQAKTLFKASIAANPIFDIPAGHLETAYIQSLTGNVAIDQSIHEKVIETDRHLLDVNPYNPFIRRNLAEAFYNLGKRDEAKRELKEAITLEPNYAPGYLRLAAWSAEDGQTAQRDEYTQEAIRIVNRYRDSTLDPFEALLLGRPQATK